MFLHLRVPRFAQWCSSATGPGVCSFQLFRNTKNTRNTHFKRLLSPRPGNGRATSAVSPWTAQTGRGLRSLYGGSDREQHCSLLVSVHWLRCLGKVSIFAILGSSPTPPPYTGTGTRGFPAAEIFLGMSVFCFIRLRPQRSRKFDLTLVARARLHLSRQPSAVSRQPVGHLSGQKTGRVAARRVVSCDATKAGEGELGFRYMVRYTVWEYRG